MCDKRVELMRFRPKGDKDMKTVAASTLTLILLVVGLLFFPGGKVNSQEQGRNIYKGPLNPNRPSPGKFRKGYGTPVPGEYNVYLRKDIPSEQVKAIAQEFVDKYGITIINSDRPDGGIWTVLIKGFAAKTSESVAMKISEDPRVDHVSEYVDFSSIAEPKQPPPSPSTRPPDDSLNN